jgi:predicted transcriptional regulator
MVIGLTVQLIDNTSKRRDRLVIMTEIMDICKNGSPKTHIMLKANLSFTQLNQFLCSLFELGLLEKLACNGRYIYRSTTRGQEFMKMQQKIINMLNENRHNRNLKSSPFEISPFKQDKISLFY